MRAHRWSEPDADGVKQCRFCPTRMAEPTKTRANYVWQRKKGAPWREVSREPLPPCVAATPAVTPEPAPVATDSAAVWPLVIASTPDILATEAPLWLVQRLQADQQARHEFGIEKYEVPVLVETGRAHSVDAYQESLDGSAYARAEFEKTGASAWLSISDDFVRLSARILHQLELAREEKR